MKWRQDMKNLVGTAGALGQELIELKKKKGKSKQEIMDEIEYYPISKELKIKLREFIEKYCEGNDKELDDMDNI